MGKGRQKIKTSCYDISLNTRTFYNYSCYFFFYSYNRFLVFKYEN